MSAVILAADDIQVAQNIGFGIIAAIMVIGALKVVTSKNVVHAALSLVLVLSGAAAQYILLGAEFVAVSQILVYVGAVMVLFLFGVMLTRAKLGKETDLDQPKAWLGVPVALLMLGVLAWVLIDGFQDERLPADATSKAAVEISDSVLGPALVPFLALTFVLVAAVIGGIVLARKD
ncbi:MAG: NADH-quinone oxidoreductase subunit J [Acidimicrobiales bacterium]|nr:NADH-quinone oxidoreductase subunit J [Acidimicrobiales bacterium]MCB9392106.1 NADH-quinone oxidoreductase subunit J [Acidimicrobiaceae bacterium]